MDLQFYGANCVSVTYKGARVVVDDNLADLGVKSVLKPDDIAVYTGAHAEPSVKTKLLVDQPGEYEVSDISITGVAARAHTDEEKTHNATMYRIVAGDITLLFTGHIYPDLSEQQLEDVGMVDVMFVPVGGNGYTLDPIGAIKVIKQVEPKLVVPTHYEDKTIHYPVPQQSLEQALKGLVMEPKEKMTKLKLKPGELSDVLQLVVLERS